MTGCSFVTFIVHFQGGRGLFWTDKEYGRNAGVPLIRDKYESANRNSVHAGLWCTRTVGSASYPSHELENVVCRKKMSKVKAASVLMNKYASETKKGKRSPKTSHLVTHFVVRFYLVMTETTTAIYTSWH